MHKKKEKYTLKKKCHDEAKTEYIQKKREIQKKLYEKSPEMAKKKILREKREIY